MQHLPDLQITIHRRFQGALFREIAYADEPFRANRIQSCGQMIITGGENVYSVEVESVLSTHPAVLEVAVIGVPSEQWGEAVKAAVVLRAGSAATEQELIAFCRDKIAGYKIPKSVDFSAEPLPKTSTGKPAKRRLRDPYWEGRKSKI